MQDQISMWFPLHLYENIHEEDIMHLKRMERNMILTFSKDSKKFLIDKKLWSSHWGSDLLSWQYPATLTKRLFFSISENRLLRCIYLYYKLYFESPD